jgi:hypothetical protein
LLLRSRPSSGKNKTTRCCYWAIIEAVTNSASVIVAYFKVDQNHQNWQFEAIRQQESYGTLSNPKVWVMQEFKNSIENHLGMPLPKGRVRFYRRDDDGQLEFTGENDIDHTPKDETIRLYTGNAFDMAGERTRTEYRADFNSGWIEESFEIKLRCGW